MLSRARPALLALALTSAVSVAARTDALPESTEPAARGLDVFVHAPVEAAPGASLPVQVEAFGFPSVVSLVPLAGATVEAAWDPESLGPASAAPPGVRVTTDGAGRAHLSVPVPEGDRRALRLLVNLRSGGHSRTRSIEVRREVAREVAVHITDAHVVPGSTISAWVVVTSAATGMPAASAPVELSLLEGGVARQTLRVTTDGAGTAMARVPIPRTRELDWSWRLRARALLDGSGDAGSGELTLVPREETPGTPTLWATWGKQSVLGGERVPYRIHVRDAASRPVGDLAVRVWTGPRGTSPPAKDEDWERASTLLRTTSAGEVTGATDAPTVLQALGTTLQLVARTRVDGHELRELATVAVGYPVSSAVLLPEAGVIVPGVAQRMLLRVLDGRGEPVVAGFTVDGDELHAQVTTDAFGEAEVPWHPPAEVGAHRQVGPCAGGVAAVVIVRPTGDVPALAPRHEPFELCLPIDREATGVLEVDRPVARIGERVHVRIRGASSGLPGARPLNPGPPAPFSVLLRSENGLRTTGTWIEDGEKGGDLELPPGAPGVWTLTAVSPSPSRAARVVQGALLVTPAVLPALGARMTGGRAAPGGTVTVEADLTDGHGHGMPGTVAAMVMDAHGGGTTAGFEALDTRYRLCGALGVQLERCDRALEGDASLDPLRRGLLGKGGAAALAPALDPGANVARELTRAFGEVLRSLEGAVMQASQSADLLLDVRRKGPRGFVFNPELMTLVTAAMDPKPMTPGGEALALADLLAVDPQVTFDNVARRITRLKLFRVLAAVRSFRRAHGLDPDEPALKAPDALLRRMVRGGELAEEALLDPWGGTLQFVKAPGPSVPFLTVFRGYELRAPGPDGVLGNADDVRDPFERVLRSGTPYAKAVQEDRIIDARFDLEVSEETVTAWQQLLEQLTGTELGNLGTIGHGSGTGSGQGFGSGHGRLGGSHQGRLSTSIVTGDAFWTTPQRTDAAGHVRFDVPLGDAETTWSVLLVGVPDGGTAATARVAIPVALPLSARVQVGAAWVEGDEVRASIALRNRTVKPVRASLQLAAGGVAALVDPKDATRAVDVPAEGAAEVVVRLRAAAVGHATFAVRTQAPGLAEDVVEHGWDVAPAGEPTELTASQWLEGARPGAPRGASGEDREKGNAGAAGKAAAEPALPASAELTVALDGMRRDGPPRLVLERGSEGLLAAALESLDPDRLGAPQALVDAVEVAVRLERWATARSGERSPLALRAAELRRRAVGRYRELRAHHPAFWAADQRVRTLADSPELKAALGGPRDGCPPASPTFDERLLGLDAEPAPEGGSVAACWDALVSTTLDEVLRTGDTLALARAILSLAERPHRAAVLGSLVDRLRERVALRASGGLTLPPALGRSRAARAVVYAALLRTARLGSGGVASAERLSAWAFVQRDAGGGYGSSLATRSVVRALLATLGAEPTEPTRVTVIGLGPEGDAAPPSRQEVEVGPSARVVLQLDPRVTRVRVEAHGPGLVARLERPVLRPWSKPPDEAASPLRLSVSWPDGAQAGKPGVLRLEVRQALGHPVEVDVRVPLPPGVELAERVSGAHQVQGALHVRRLFDASDLPTLIELPVRFGLSGVVTVPEAEARVALDEVPRAVAPSRPLHIE